MSTQMLEVSLLGVGMNAAPSRKGRVVNAMVKMNMSSNKMRTPPPTRHLPSLIALKCYD